MGSEEMKSQNGCTSGVNNKPEVNNETEPVEVKTEDSSVDVIEGNLPIVNKVIILDDVNPIVENNENDTTVETNVNNTIILTTTDNVESDTIPHSLENQLPSDKKERPTISRVDNNTDKESEVKLLFESTSKSTEISTVLLRKESHQFCRICHEVGIDDVFISPCRCKGSMSLVHKWCLERWLAESDTNHCELCGFVFTVSRSPKYNILWSLFLWLWEAAPRREKQAILYDTILFSLFCPIIILSTIFTFQVAETLIMPEINEKVTKLQTKYGFHWRREDVQLVASLFARLVQMTIISLIITVDVGFASWAILRIQHHLGRWYRWYRRNCKVLLRGYQEIRIPNSSTTESSANIRTVSF